MSDNFQRPLRILHVNTHDIAGGAAKTAFNLLNIQRQRGHRVWMAVGQKRSQDRDVFVIPNDLACCGWERFWATAQSRLAAFSTTARGMGFWRLSCAAYALSNPARWWEKRQGIENFHFPGSYSLLQLPPERPDIVQFHNLHGEYFDPRAITQLSSEVPVVLKLSDEWPLTGHCSYSLNCEQWKIGCGACPDLNIYPSIQRDATASNWRRKLRIFQASRLFVVTESQWLMKRAQKVMFPNSKSRCIPPGIDLGVFRPAIKTEIRHQLRLPSDKIIILFAGALARSSPFKDYPTFEAALQHLDSKTAAMLYVITLGDRTPDCEEQIGSIPVRRIPYQTDDRSLAAYYQSVDLNVHTARTELWGLTITESLACGTPVLATAVGGIPDQIRGLTGLFPGILPDLNCTDLTQATGLLVPPSDPDTLAAAITAMAQRPDLLRTLGDNAARHAKEQFGVEKCADTYLNWYEEIIHEFRASEQPTKN